MYDFKKLGEDFLDKAIAKFSEEHYPIEKMSDVVGRMDGSPYLYFDYGYESDFGIFLIYQEHTRHDTPYSITLDIPYSEIDDYKIKYEDEETFTMAEVMEIAKYCYEFHATTSFPEKSFEENCKNNLLQKLKSDGKRI